MKVLYDMLRGEVFALLANAIRMTPQEAYLVEIAFGPTLARSEWPSMTGYWNECQHFATLTRRAYPTIEESPLAATWNGAVPGRTEEVVRAEIAPEILDSFRALINILRDAEQVEFPRLMGSGRAAHKKLGATYPGVTRYATTCDAIAMLVQKTRDQWS